METTLILLKPDCVKRRLIGKVISRFEDKGLRIAGMKLMKMDEELAAKHYEAHVGKPFYAGLVSFMTSDPIVALAVEGPNAIEVCRNMMGATFGFKAAPGTIRGDYGISNQYNLVHGSDSPEAAERELGLFFPGGEGILSWSTADADLHACD
ncbi:MAG: nucleoside-diphosphate kinase [Planctomycetota bacterium]|nr:MAG: nucleoside-diphosphate kinase [Planctomycetota bacterium]